MPTLLENDCLTTPLLSSSSPDVVVDVDSTIGEPQEVLDPPNWEVLESQNPFEFMGAPIFSLPPPCSIDPFRNHTDKITGVYEWVKILVCLPIALIRLVIFGIALAVGYVATKIALYGWRDKHNPMPKWRCRIMWVTRICTRCILLSFGYHWIRRIGRPASRETAPIIVSNHVSYIDPIFFFYELFPTMVSSESHDSIPFVGTIIRAMQVIYVDRFSTTSRKYAVSEIKDLKFRGRHCPTSFLEFFCFLRVLLPMGEPLFPFNLVHSFLDFLFNLWLFAIHMYILISLGETYHC